MLSNTYTTHRRQLYILPTKAGYFFSLIVFLLFLASIKFSHQATFLLTFLLCGFGVVSALHTQKNINQISINVKKSPPIFLTEQTSFICELNHSTNIRRHNLWLVCGDQKISFDLEPRSTFKQNISLTPTERGVFIIPAITLTSHFPIGILFGWSKAFDAKVNCIVYPQPKNLLASPDSALVQADESRQQPSNTLNQQQNSGEISSLKPYQIGDRLRDIHWPSFAKTNQLVTKEYENNVDSKRIFTWHHVSALSTEKKLSQLTFWLIEAENNQQEYQLSIPGFQSSHSKGPEHLHNCLIKLALWEKH